MQLFITSARQFSAALCFTGFLTASLPLHAGLHAAAIDQPIRAAVVEVSELKHLALYLYDQTGTQQKPAPYLTFNKLKAALQQQCKSMTFAMNAGMFHADFSPVGLYVENDVQLRQLNRAQHGYGNFLIQPNGVLAWNDDHAVIETTDQYSRKGFKAKYATQSGPMLVIDGKLNPNFLPDSSSYKLRNGVGIKGQSLYFVISREPVTFYQFASYFKDQLKTPNALYLDGSLSSIYSEALHLHDAFRALGPMIAYTEPAAACK